MKIIDFHVHPIPGEVDEKRILKEMDKAQVNMAVLLALDLPLQHLKNEKEKRVFSGKMPKPLYLERASSVKECGKNSPNSKYQQQNSRCHGKKTSRKTDSLRFS